MPVRACSTRASSSVSRPRDGSASARAAVAWSGVGTKWRRVALGSDLSRATARSSRSPGTCQSKPSDVTRLSTATGTCTVTPSAASPGRELVGHVELEVALAPGARVVGRRDLLPRVRGEQLLGEGEQVGPPPPLAAPPAVEVPLGGHVRRDAGVVEREQHLVVDDDVAPPGPLLELGDPVERRAVALPELVLRLPVALDEGRADEDLAGGLGVDPGVLDRAVGHERHAVKRDPLGRDGRAGLAAPARLAHGARHDVRTDLLGPLRLDRWRRPGPTAGSSPRARRT